MRVKRANLFELHVEKAILAIGVIFCLIVFWSYVISSPYTVTIDSQLGVKPDQVERKVLEQVRKLNDQIRPGSRSPLPDMSVPSYNNMFRSRLVNAAAVTGGYIPLGHAGLSMKFVPKTDDGGTIPLPPQRPQPAWLALRPGFGVLLDHEAIIKPPDDEATDLDYSIPNGPGIAQAYLEEFGIDDQPPRDFRYVSVAGLFEVAQWRQLLRDTEGLPEEWWRSSLAATDVVLERQVFDANAKRWGEVEVVPLLPGANSFREAHHVWTVGEAQDTIAAIKDGQDKIVQPLFAPMAEGITWVAPQVRLSEPSSGEEPSELEVLSEEIRNLRTQIDQATTGPTRIRNLRKVDQFKIELAEKIAQRKKLLDQDPKAGEGDRKIDPSRWWKVWAHDLTVQPGVTYRYRLRVSVINPLFQRSQLTGTLRETHFHLLSLTSPASEWSEPIEIEPVHRFFVVGGSGVEHSATIEVWRVFNGRSQASEFSVKPGDQIGGVIGMNLGDEQVDVDMTIKATVIDLVDIESPTNFGNRTTLALILDTVTNEMYERTIEEDRASPIRAMLIDESSPEAFVAEASP